MGSEEGRVLEEQVPVGWDQISGISKQAAGLGRQSDGLGDRQKSLEIQALGKP